jgi:WD40 repeat protein
VRFVNYESGETAFTDLETPSQPVAVRSSPDGKVVVVLCHLGHVLMIDSAKGKARSARQAFPGWPADHGYVIRDRIRFSPSGNQFALWGAGPQVEIRDAATGALVKSVRHPQQMIHDVQFAPDGETFVSCSSDMTARVWNTHTERPNPEDPKEEQKAEEPETSALQVLPHSGWVFSAQFSSDGKRLLTSCKDGQARLWNLTSGQTFVTTLAQNDEVFGVCFGPGEEYFLASGRDGRISVWDTTLGKMLAPPRYLGDMVYQLTLTGTSSHVVASGRLKQIRGVDLDNWVRAPDERLREDLRYLGEIISSQRIHEGGAATALSKDEWVARWNALRAKNLKIP